MSKYISCVKLLSEETELYTEALDFDLKSNVGYYISGADIISGQNKLNSREGYYYSKSTMYFLKIVLLLSILIIQFIPTH